MRQFPKSWRKTTHPPHCVSIRTHRAIPLFFRLQRSGLSVPGDISVTGFDDSTFAKEAELTTGSTAPIRHGRRCGTKGSGAHRRTTHRGTIRDIPRAVASTKLNRKTTHRSPAVGRSVYSREITSRNTPRQPVYLRYVWQILLFIRKHLAYIWHVALRKQPLRGCIFEVFTTCVCHV